jgi:hypothetical protein
MLGATEGIKVENAKEEGNKKKERKAEKKTK